MKSNKSFSKRIKVTRNGKLITRKIGQGHNNSKESTREKLAKGRSQQIQMTAKSRARFLPGLPGKSSK